MGQYSKLSDKGKSLVDVACVLVVTGMVVSWLVWLCVGK